jgi:2-haloacid dehalogenase
LNIKSNIKTFKKTKVILFDTFGTIVDWRSSIMRAGKKIANRKNIRNIDWDAFARSWRAGYHPGMLQVQSRERSWVSIDTIHREQLDKILSSFKIDQLFTESEKTEINLLWHKLDPWPDSIPGLTRIKQKFLIGPLSNGSLILLASMAKRASIPWDFILSSDTFKAYKKDAKVYLGAIDLIGIKPSEILMVAAHNDDLKAARSHGMRTAFINRAYEYGVDQTKDFDAEEKWDLIADGIEDLATALGC